MFSYQDSLNQIDFKADSAQLKQAQEKPDDAIAAFESFTKLRQEDAPRGDVRSGISV